mmetsp:Transcript_24900/g.74809  ORF Transcript_24900/g.74809 Transcript_24900/m.74809 type:complete len:162 (-) Transcript_24900:81-566(-)
MAAAEPKGRGNLPGIPAYVDRVSSENIWRDFCNSETEYLRLRQSNPPKTRENFGALHGFEVVRQASYISVRPVRPNRNQAQLAGSLLGRVAAEAAVDTASSAEAAAASAVESQEASRSDIPLELPKYTRFSEDHMLPMEVAPHRNKSAQNLKRSISQPLRR